MKKVLRPICYFLYYLIAKHLPESHSIFSLGISGKIRTLLTRGIIDSCGKSVDIEKNAKFSPHIKIGHHSGLGINSLIQAGLGINSLIQENVEIGNYVMMGPNVSIYTKNHKTSLEKPMIFQGFEEAKKVIIKDDVWIGSNVIILPGVTIESGTIIGAGSVVTKDVLKNTIVAGNPAKVIKERK